MNDEKTEIGLYNPLSHDFICSYDAYGKGPQEYKVPSREIAYFTPEVARHVKKHLYDDIVNTRNLNGIDLNADPEKKQAIIDEIEVEL